MTESYWQQMGRWMAGEIGEMPVDASRVNAAKCAAVIEMLDTDDARRRQELRAQIDAPAGVVRTKPVQGRLL